MIQTIPPDVDTNRALILRQLTAARKRLDFAMQACKLDMSLVGTFRAIQDESLRIEDIIHGLEPAK